MALNFFIILVQVTTYTLARYQGQSCTSITGAKGYCISQKLCASQLHYAVENSRICNNTKGHTVCCPLFEKIVTPSSRGRQKCLEYAFTEDFRFLNFLNKMRRLYPFKSFIVGGVQAAAKEFPHMAALGYGEDDIQWQCGGSLINEKFVMTAAHCVSSTEIGELTRVRLGDLDLQNTDDDAHLQEFSVARTFRHPEYAPPALYNDIALIQLTGLVQITEYVRPACLKTSPDIPNSNPIATGWGRLQFVGPTSSQLEKVSLEYFSNDACNQAYASVPIRQLPERILNETQICAGGIAEQRDTCQGDSGGPLQVVDSYNPKLYYIIGITSFGKGCGTSNNPGVYTRVSHYVPWIEEIIWADE